MLSGTTAIVTGSSNGIGAAIATKFAEYGADVGISYYTDKEGALATAQAVEAHGGSAVVVKADFGDRGDCEEFVAETRAGLGGIDVLVNNVGITNRITLEEMTYEEWERLFDVNVDSIFHLCKAVMPEMVDRGHGSVINMSSVRGQKGGKNRTGYGATKGAIDALTRHLCREYEHTGVRINTVSPGAIETSINDEIMDDEDAYTEVSESVPLGRWGQPEEIAEVVAFLASSRGSYINGENVTVDGGLFV